MPRPTELTGQVHADLVEAVEAGQTYKGAAEFAGVSERSLYRWLLRGEQGDGAPYVRLWQDVTRARAKAKHSALRQITSAMTPGEYGVEDWRARAWWLERAFPEEFGKRTVIRMEVERGLQEICEAVEPLMSRGAYAEFIQALAAVQGLDEAEAGEDTDLPAEH